tara:strand:- start:7793 stop:8155 length:363 start_codon:yes stop_codon:yes gene_type:complete
MELKAWLPEDLIIYIISINTKDNFKLVMNELIKTVDHCITGFEESWNPKTQQLDRAETIEISYYEHKEKTVKKRVRYRHGEIDPYGLWKCVLYVVNITDSKTVVLFNSPIDNKTSIYIVP